MKALRNDNCMDGSVSLGDWTRHLKQTYGGSPDQSFWIAEEKLNFLNQALNSTNIKLTTPTPEKLKK